MGGAERLCGIFDEWNANLGKARHERGVIAGTPEEIDRDDRGHVLALGLKSPNGLQQERHVDVSIVGTTIDEGEFCPRVGNGIRCGDKGHRRKNHHSPRTSPDVYERQVERRRTRRQREAPRYAHTFSHLLLKAVDKRT